MKAMLSSTSGSQETVTLDELKSLIFSNDQMTVLSNTIQGVQGGEVEQNWLCSSNTVPSLTQRMVAISRMAQFCNFGEGVPEVKYFILILCPSNIKGIISSN